MSVLLCCRNLDITFRVTEKRWRHSTWSANAKSCTHTHTSLSMSQTQKCPLVTAYHLLYGLHQKTSFVSIRPHSSAHSVDSNTQRPTLPSWPSIRSFDHLAETGDVVLAVLARAGQTIATPQRHYRSVPANLWRQAILRGHGGATRRPELATRWRWRRRRIAIRDLNRIDYIHTFHHLRDSIYVLSTTDTDLD